MPADDRTETQEQHRGAVSERLEFYARPAIASAMRKAREAGHHLGASGTTVEVVVKAALDQLYVTGFLLTPAVREAVERSGYERARKEIEDWLEYRGLPPGTSLKDLIEAERDAAKLAAGFELLAEDKSDG